MLFKKIIKYIFYSIALFFGSSIIAVVLTKWINPVITPAMLLRSIEGVFEGKFVGINQDWVSFEEISPNFFRAVVAAEDAKFMRHDGFDRKAIEAAKRYNEIHKGKKKRGASTISMQTAKNTFLYHWRNYVRKALEAYFTILIENIWGKKRIIEVYANVIEFGEGLYGVEAASQYFFGKSARNLSRREAALLAAVLPNPHRWSPARPTPYINRRVAWIMGRMNSVAIPKA
ncbi:MAG TPA: monofunctional biosynthetic peptidoglycan transglycosylase [Candidatus Kapabacteria bacterium]|jgi:monofunctional biosynthetic peptidoglycan transglycosylase|nr:monofunctional biosynthetic peptidoglycan transglycosylase [Candidatus Kapabacteria bacterium]HOQ49239.1 monofunctional biosynthetic peptidoglycan transglycosylase [Candidatus Kapabacteria bacterium]HPU24494.1 monofunctional biosynthetic peptidoglycan transglycosylase [Candidatus Kapabacteria bacterium]